MTARQIFQAKNIARQIIFGPTEKQGSQLSVGMETTQETNQFLEITGIRLKA